MANHLAKFEDGRSKGSPVIDETIFTTDWKSDRQTKPIDIYKVIYTQLFEVCVCWWSGGDIWYTYTRFSQHLQYWLCKKEITIQNFDICLDYHVDKEPSWKFNVMENEEYWRGKARTDW